MYDNLVLVSGGIDSTVLAHKLVKHEKKKVRGLFFDFDTEASPSGRAFSRRLAFELDFPLEILKFESLKRLAFDYDPSVAFKSYIMDEEATTVLYSTPIDLFASILAVVSFHAHEVKVDEVLFGLTAEQLQTNPELPNFFTNFSDALNRANTKLPEIKFATPFSTLTKPEIVALGVKLGVSYQDTWSCCYSRKKHCGTCVECKRRKGAFQEAKIEDPTAYRN